MSTPANPLAKFRTYSYHHILIACDNDAAADWISDPDRSSSVFRQIGEGLGVGAEDSRPIDLDEKGNPIQKEKLTIGHYVVILNGMIDTRYVIQNAQWFTATAVSTDKQDRFNSIAVEGSMEVQEPGGIVFMNALDAASNILRTDPTGIIWILKTIFVGHGDDPSGAPIREHISNIRPLRFMIYDVTGVFDVSGGVYNISFVGASNGASRLPQFSRAAEQITFTPSDSSLQTSLNTLAERMTTQSTENRRCIIDALNLSYDSPTNSDGETLESMRGVSYQITLDAPYNDVDKYKVTGWDCRQTETSVPGSSGAFKFGKSSTVEQAIRHIMERCDRVLKDRTEGDEEGIKYIYKIHSKISMIGKDDPDALQIDTTENFDTVQVKYVVRRFAEVTNQTVEKVLGLDPNTNFDFEAVNNPIVRQNLIEFDYFFTGKNIDILDFDMKMEMGLAFMQTLASTNTTTDQVELISKGMPRNGVYMNGQENQKGSILVRNRTPIFPATKTKDVLLRNAGDPKDTTLFNAYLSRHAALESLEANITILGNPYLMSQTNRQVDDALATRHVQDDSNEDAEQQNILLNWDRIPGLVKLNIYMPRTNDTPSSTERLDLVRFWYQGFYYLYGIQHKFNEGQFTQELQMLSLPNQSEVEENNQEELLTCGTKPDPATDAEKPTGTADPESSPQADEAVESVGATNMTTVEDCIPSSTEGG